MLLHNRIIFSDNGTLTDWSQDLSNIYASTQVMAFVSAQDYLYIGSDFPFNHRYFDVSVVNAQTSALSTVEIWDGSEWNAAVDIIDGTSVGGKSLAQSGIVYFSVDRNESWGMEDTTQDIAALSTLKIYNMYWARFRWSADLTGTTALNYVGFRFSDDTDLRIQYPNLMQSALLTAYTSGKTNWKEQHVTAAEDIIRELVRKDIVFTGNQVLDPRLFKDASVQRTAGIIYASFGEQYSEQRDYADKMYAIAMNKKNFHVDKNGDGRLEPHEKRWEARAYRS